MKLVITPLCLDPTLAGGEGNSVSDQSSHGGVDVETETNKHRRKLQNRKNQRAHRLRVKAQDSGSGSVSGQTSSLFQVRRWRVDEVDDFPFQEALSASKAASDTDTYPRPPRPGVSISYFPPGHASVLRRPSPAPVPSAQQTSLTPPSFIFPLSTDHLLHLVQYNVFRAFVSNKRTLNTLLTGWTDHPPSPTTCPISGPYRDDTMVYPLNPNIPLSLVPTRLQQTFLHSFWINLFPFPCLRDNLIRRDGNFDHWELLEDLIGELMGGIPFEQRQGTPSAIVVSDPKPTSARHLRPSEGCDESEMTAGRKGLIVWGEPYDMRNWEATPGFLEKWSWATDRCDDLVESSNHWRSMRGEEPIRLPEARR
ncbi:hypothetical protein BKA64DRAFT_593627 [Cadophora sp. MPI-SDFR-AT-0126]|nr:hypothetical protein BKA64DRAFT_593627 [Leotiomycetes sp. MPI-SDFR-AT-0126]